jgi:hypothetical protein
MAVAAIQLSLTGTFRPAARSRDTSSAQASQTASPTASGSNRWASSGKPTACGTQPQDHGPAARPAAARPASPPRCPTQNQRTARRRTGPPPSRSARRCQPPPAAASPRPVIGHIGENRPQLAPLPATVPMTSPRHRPPPRESQNRPPDPPAPYPARPTADASLLTATTQAADTRYPPFGAHPLAFMMPRGVFEIGHYGRVLRYVLLRDALRATVLSPRQDVVR